jgi:hypothetical protein
MFTIDRISFAVQLSAQRRVLDIGGQKMANCDPNSPFARLYSKIEQSAREYRIVDYQQEPSVEYVIDFNKPESIPQIRAVLDEYRPEVILCMEILEHINYHFELMNEMARAVQLYGSTIFITVPNNGNWVFNALGWNHDHSTAFFRDIAYRFVTRSNLGNQSVLVAPCMQKYLWYWWVVYGLSFFQPMSWGFLISTKENQRTLAIESLLSPLQDFTRTAFLKVPR